MSKAAPADLPPGPRLPGVLQGALLYGHGPRFLAACQRRYGSVFTLRIVSIGTLVYLVDPADIKAVFAGDPSVLHAGEANSILSGLLGESSLLVIDEDVHRDRRRLMVPPFTRDAVARQAGLMSEIAAANIAGWPVGKSFAAAPKMSEITLEVILRTVIGATDPVRLAALRKVIPRVLNVGPWQTMALLYPNLLRRRPWQGLRRRIAEADGLLYAEIADRRANPNLATRTNTLAMHGRVGDYQGCAKIDGELLDELMTRLVGGHDTTATGLSWALERLTRHPAALTKAVRAAQASAADDAAGAIDLDAMAKETAADPPGGVRRGSGPNRSRSSSPAIGCLPGSWWRRVSGWYTRAPRCTRIPTDSTLIGCLAPPLSPTICCHSAACNRRCLFADFAIIEMRMVLREVLRWVEAHRRGRRRTSEGSTSSPSRTAAR